jgi:hypothetical protein
MRVVGSLTAVVCLSANRLIQEHLGSVLPTNTLVLELIAQAELLGKMFKINTGYAIMVTKAIIITRKLSIHLSHNMCLNKGMTSRHQQVLHPLGWDLEVRHPAIPSLWSRQELTQ